MQVGTCGIGEYMIYINDMKKPYREGMTLLEALKENNIKTDSNMFNIFVNDDQVDPEDFGSFILSDEDSIDQMFPFFID